MVNVKIFYDFICPFSYICKKIFDKLSKEYPLNIEYYTKELHVNIPNSGIKTNELLKVLPKYSLILQMLSNIGEGYGIKINDVKVKYNTKTALILSKMAKRYKKESEYIDIVYKLMFDSLDNISDMEIIEQVFSNLDMPNNYSDNDIKKCYVEYSSDTSSAIDLGVTGVPFVIINDEFKIQGLRDEKFYIQKIKECLDSSYKTSMVNENKLKLIEI